MFAHVKFASLPVSDQDRALAFYSGPMGLTVETDAPYMEGARWIELGVPGARTRILFAPRADTQPGSVPVLNLVTDDLDSTFRTLSEMGVEFMQPPSDAPWSPGERYALMHDSEGNVLLLGQPAG